MIRQSPPKLALKFFRWYCSEERLEELEGDLLEQFEIDKEMGRSFPTHRFYWNVIRCAKAYAYERKKVNQSKNQLAMLKSSFLAVYRGFKRNPTHGSLNVFGLALAIAAFGLVTIYLHYETNFEDFHSQADEIYRVTYKSENEDNSLQWARVPVSYVNDLPKELAGIKSLIRFQNNERKYIKVGSRKFLEDYVYQTDANVFDVFSFDLLLGNPKTALANPKSIVLTETLAKKYFGDEPALGQKLSLSGEWHPEAETYKVTGVIKDVPANTHLPVNTLISFNTPEERTWWGYIYIQVDEGVTPDQLAKPLTDFVTKYSESGSSQQSFVLQPLSEIHLTSNLAREIIPNGSLQNVKIFGVIGILILTIGLINFTNLNSVIFLSKFKEVGVRKVLGARKQQIVTSVFFESVVYALIAFTIGIGFLCLLLPSFRAFSGVELLLNPLTLLTGLFLISTVVGIMAGIYPSMLVARVKPVLLLKKYVPSLASFKDSSFSLKKVMLVLQFSIALLLIGSALVATDQFSFLSKKNLEMRPEQVLALPRVPNYVKDNYQVFKSNLEQISGIQSVSACLEVPSREIRDQGALVISSIHGSREEAPMVDIQVVGHEFFELMNINLLEGSFFPDYIASRTYPEFTEEYTYVDYLVEQKRAYLINESGMKALGFENPNEVIGLTGAFDQDWLKLADGPIVGVVEDYHQATLKNTIDPTVYVYEPLWLNTILMRVESKDIAATVGSVESEWNELFPNFKIEPHFLDDLYNQLYFKERKQLQLLYIFSVLAVVIAFLGIFALVAYVLKTKTKEYGIRKVLGARLVSLLLMTGKDYALLLFIGLLTSIPVSYFAMNAWLSNFAYSVSISPFNFVLAFISLIVLLALTVGYQTVRTSNANPVDALRDE